MGSIIAKGTMTGLGPACVKDESNASTGILHLIRWIVVPSFFSHIKLASQDTFEQNGWTVSSSKDSKFMYRANSATARLSSNELSDPGKLSKITNWIKIRRQANGLRTIKCVDPSQFTKFVDSATGGVIPKEAIYDSVKLLKYCTPLSRRQQQHRNNYCGSFLSLHSTSLLNPQEYNLCGDGPDYPGVVRVCLVGPGLCTESTHAFADIPITVVAFIEYGDNFNYAKKCFPNAQGFYDIRVVNRDLEDKTLVFPAYDLLVYTAPCYRNTPLRSENGLPVPASAVVFVEEQRKFVKLTSPDHVLNEHVPTRPECHDEHDSLIEFFSSSGYNTATDMLDACSVGDRTSRFRWFCLASRKAITSFDVCKVSKMSTHPKPMEDILEEESSEMSYKKDTAKQFVPGTVSNLFQRFRSGQYKCKSVLPHENAFACVLLAWIHGKSKKGHIPEFGVSDSGQIDLANSSSNSSAIAYIYSLLLRQFPGASVSLRCSFQLLYQRDPPQCDVYFGARTGDLGVYFTCGFVRSAASVSRRQVVDAMNARPRSARLASGGEEILFEDAMNYLRSHVRATLCHSHNRFHTNDPYLNKKKGTTGYLTSGPAPTITSDMNIIIDVTHRHESPNAPVNRYMTTVEAARASSFTADCLESLQSMDEETARKMISNAIPRFMLTAVYLTVCSHILGDDMSTHSLSVLLHVHARPLICLDVHTELSPSDVRDNISDSRKHRKKKHAPKAPTSGWRPCPSPTSKEYADAKFSVDFYHKITHRSWQQIESDIEAGTTLGFDLKPGDSRMMSPCADCEANQCQIRIPKHSDRWHENETNHLPGEAGMIDIWYSPVQSRNGHHKYVLIFVCISSGLVIDIPMKKLDTECFMESMHDVYNQLHLDFGVKLKLVVSDSFSSFVEQRKLLKLKLQLQLEIEPLPPYLHNYNYAENYIKIVRNAAVVSIQQLRGHFIGNRLITPEQFLIDAIHHSACVINQTSSASILRKYNTKISPRKFVGKAHNKEMRDLRILPFGEPVFFVNDKSKLKTAEKIGINKAKLRGIPGYYLYPANYHPLYAKKISRVRLHQ